MNLFADAVVSRNAKRFVFLDFDSLTLSEEGDPRTIPPSAVCKVLNQIALTRPWAVFLNIDITGLAAGREFSDLTTALKFLYKSGIPVFLGRDLLGDPRDNVLPHFRETELGALVESSDNISWFSTASNTSSDGIERRVSPIVAGTNGYHGSTKEWIPSAARGALLLDRSKSAREAKEAFQEAILNPHQNCGSPPLPRNVLRFCTVPLLDLSTETWPDRGQANVRYTMRWKSGKFDIIPISVGQMLSLGGSPQPLAPSLFNGSIVIIGSSAGDRVELRQTPLGEMPGSLILANMIRSWLEFGPSQNPSWRKNLFSILGVTVLSSAIALGSFMLFGKSWPQLTRWGLPFLLSAMLWAIFYMWDNAFNPAGLVVLQFVVQYATVSIAQRAHQEINQRTGS